MKFWYNIGSTLNKLWYNIDILHMSAPPYLFSIVGHRSRSIDAVGHQLCHGSQWTPHHEHAHRLPTGSNNIGDTVKDWDW